MTDTPHPSRRGKHGLPVVQHESASLFIPHPSAAAAAGAASEKEEAGSTVSSSSSSRQRAVAALDATAAAAARLQPELRTLGHALSFSAAWKLADDVERLEARGNEDVVCFLAELQRTHAETLHALREQRQLFLDLSEAVRAALAATRGGAGAN